MARQPLTEIEWFRFYADCRGVDEFPVVFTAPGVCDIWDDSWVAITCFDRKKIYLDPRPTQHGKGGFVESAMHEMMHAVRGPGADWRKDEPFICRVSPALYRILRPSLPPLPSGLERLRRAAYRHEAKLNKGEH